MDFNSVNVTFSRSAIITCDYHCLSLKYRVSGNLISLEKEAGVSKVLIR